MNELELIALHAPRQTAGIAPLRAPGSVRRTSTIDVSWPDGAWGDRLFDARARDVFTPQDGCAPQLRAEDSFVAVLDGERTIRSIHITPPRPAETRLVGLRGGGHLRRALDEIMPEERSNGTPLYLILDDISGASLVSSWAWSQWTDDWLHSADGTFDEENFARQMAARIDICTGLAMGGVAQRLGANRRPSTGAPTPDLRNPLDPEGWHEYPTQHGVGMRRARRIDVARGDAGITIEAMFQDSATLAGGGRGALHEYTLSAVVDPEMLRIASIDAQPRVLPFPECPGATQSLPRLIGEPLSELRTLVVERLRGIAGCTHLNDALRALAEVPPLAAMLERP
jgi:hypothetical protein